MKARLSRYSLLILLLLTLCVCGCSKFRQIRPLSARVVSIMPEGFRTLNIMLETEIDNPACQLTLYDVGGQIMNSGTIIGSYAVDPVILKAKSLDKYHVRLVLTLSKEMTIFGVMSLLNADVIKKCTIDVEARVALKSGISKRFVYKDIPIGNYMNF